MKRKCVSERERTRKCVCASCTCVCVWLNKKEGDEAKKGEREKRTSSPSLRQRQGRPSSPRRSGPGTPWGACCIGERGEVCTRVCICVCLCVHMCVCVCVSARGKRLLVFSGLSPSERETTATTNTKRAQTMGHVNLPQCKHTHRHTHRHTQTHTDTHRHRHKSLNPGKVIRPAKEKTLGSTGQRPTLTCCWR